jgi:site-specific DNA-methyltransferase (cytosine-N4-specific)
MTSHVVHRADARSIPEPDGKFHSIVTSPPYFALRRYGTDDAEIGAGDVTTYLNDMAACAREWKRLLADEGLLWLNVGDTASGSGGAGGDYNRGGAKQGRPRYRQGKVDRDPMQWLNLPHRVVEVFVAEGWLYRSCVTWDKASLRPEDLSHARRPGISHEFIFMLAKDRGHRFFDQRLVERGSVWHFGPARRVKHQAPFPIELPMRCIPLSTQPGEWVLDPFAGSLTTMNAALQLDRQSVGVDLYAPTPADPDTTQ